MSQQVFNQYNFYKFALLGLKTGRVDGQEIEPILERTIKTVLARYNGAVYGDFKHYYSSNMFFGGKLPGFMGLDVEPIPSDAGLEVLKVGGEQKYLDKPCNFAQVGHKSHSS